MTYRVIIQPRAARDIWAAAQWLEDQSRSAAKALRLVRGIRAKIETLKANPKRCPVDPDSAAYGEEVRMLLYGKRHGKYRVLYAIRGDTVHVLTVSGDSWSSLFWARSMTGFFAQRRQKGSSKDFDVAVPSDTPIVRIRGNSVLFSP
jgi:plasmid stabilization system protein ParE